MINDWPFWTLEGNKKEAMLFNSTANTFDWHFYCLFARFHPRVSFTFEFSFAWGRVCPVTFDMGFWCLLFSPCELERLSFVFFESESPQKLKSLWSKSRNLARSKHGTDLRATTTSVRLTSFTKNVPHVFLMKNDGEKKIYDNLNVINQKKEIQGFTVAHTLQSRQQTFLYRASFLLAQDRFHPKRKKTFKAFLRSRERNLRFCLFFIIVVVDPGELPEEITLRDKNKKKSRCLPSERYVYMQNKHPSDFTWGCRCVEWKI